MIPISLDITTVILYFLMCLTGDFKRVILTFIIIIIHETGHLIFLKTFKVLVTKLTIYPFGGLIKTDKLINFSPLKELLISIGGIINQLILYIFFFNLYKYNLINTYTYNLFLSINTSLILFNIIVSIIFGWSKNFVFSFGAIAAKTAFADVLSNSSSSLSNI